ncbi:MAG: FIST signal transduction protein [Desulfobaccales bacterium]
MPAKKSYVVILMAVFVMIGAGAAYVFWSTGQKELHLIPQKKAVSAAGPASGAEVGTGWSVKEDPGEAVREALGMALQGKQQAAPDFVAIFASSGTDLRNILVATRKLLGNQPKIYGGTSDSRGLMTNRGFIHAGEKDYAITGKVKGLAVMTVSSRNIVFGVGSADFSRYATPKEGARAAMRQALESSGKSSQETPQAILAVISRSVEDEALKGISEVVGHHVPLLGGTTGGPKFEVLGDQEVFAQGISLAVIYTKLPLCWVFEGGFEVPDTYRGVVTKMDGAAVLQINWRPALDVYDEWLGGKISKLQREGADLVKIRNFMSLNPFYRRYTSPDGHNYFLFSVPWPRNQTPQDKSFVTSTEISMGDEIHLSHGTWERLINRVGNLPLKARIQCGIAPEWTPLLGIGFVCAGVMRAIPEAEWEKMPLLINYANNQAPFIAAFSWGEQGYFPGVGYKHGNLLTSFLVIGEKELR